MISNCAAGLLGAMTFSLRASRSAPARFPCARRTVTQRLSQTSAPSGRRRLNAHSARASSSLAALSVRAATSPALRQGLVQSQQIGRSERLKARRLRRSGEDRHERLPSGGRHARRRCRHGAPARRRRRRRRDRAVPRPAPRRPLGGEPPPMPDRAVAQPRRAARSESVATPRSLSRSALLIQRLEPSDEIVARPRRKPCLGGVAKSSAHRRDGHTAWLQTPAFPSRSRRSSERPSAHLSCPRVL
jgi:hypothetical protein